MLWSLNAVCPGGDRRALTDTDACCTLDSLPAKGLRDGLLVRADDAGRARSMWP